MAGDEPITKRLKGRDPKKGTKKGQKIPAADNIIDSDQEEIILAESESDVSNIPPPVTTTASEPVDTGHSLEPAASTSGPSTSAAVQPVVPQITPISEALLRQLIEMLSAKTEQKHEALTEEEKRFAALDKAFRSTTPTRTYLEAEKLQGRQNFTTWLETIMIDLRGYSLSAFVEAPLAEGIVEISPMRRVALDAQTLQFLRLALTKSVQFTVADAKTAFEAMELVKKHHGNDKHHDMIEIDRKWCHLKFWPNYDKNRFVYEFNQLVKRFSEHGVTLADSYLVIAFLQRMQGLFNSSGSVAIFYRQLRAENLDKIDLHTLQTRFVQQNFHEKIEDKSSSLKRKHVESKGEIKSKVVDNSRRMPSISGAGPSKEAKRVDKPSHSRDKHSASHHQTGGNIKSKPLNEKYTKDQLEKIKTMTPDEKKKVRCSKCNDYFHSSQECPNAGKLCYICKYYGHEANDCRYKNKDSKPKSQASK